MPAFTLVLLNKTLRILPITVGRTNIQNSLDFLTALLAERHKRGRLRHQREVFAFGGVFDGGNDMTAGAKI